MGDWFPQGCLLFYFTLKAAWTFVQMASLLVAPVLELQSFECATGDPSLWLHKEPRGKGSDMWALL